MQPDTIFDLASLTKVVGALPVTLFLRQRGALDLDAPVRDVLPEFHGEGRERVTFRHLLAHTSGLPSWRALYVDATSDARRQEQDTGSSAGETRAAVLDRICRTPLTYAPGEGVEYSDLGILLLGFALERIGGRQLDALVQQLVVDPLGLMCTFFCPPAHLQERCASTEAGNAYERAKVGEEGVKFPWRDRVLRGEVHDGNAHYAMGGVAAHAGLFSTAWDVGTVGLQWLRPGAWLPSELVEEATSDQTGGAADCPRGLGWALHQEGGFFDAFGRRSFGHTGFTGTSVVIDPDADVAIVLLTNRVHPRAQDGITEFRRRFHQAVWEAVGGG
jgi:CubicO group peptidase (beta-lactamase class C family)